MTIACVAERVSPTLYKAFFWDGTFEAYERIRSELEMDFEEAEDTQFLGSVSPMNTDEFVFFLVTHLKMSLNKADTTATIAIKVTVPKNFWLVYEIETDGRATNPRVVDDARFIERYNRLQELTRHMSIVLQERESVKTIENRVKKECAARALAAKLPDNFRWGADAMEQFDFGKERAAKAILGEE